MCELTRERLELLLAGDLDPEQTDIVARHLDEDCATCDALLEEHGLDEETLSLYLVAARQPEPHPASVERVWRNVQPRRRWTWGVGGLAFAGAAATLLLVLVPGRPDPYTGVKGEIELPRAGLGLHWTTNQTAELRYSLERDAHITIVHAREDVDPTVVASTRVLAASNATVPHDGGALAWSFAGEPGVHLFLLVVSDGPLPEESIPELVRDDWFDLPDGWRTGHIDNHDVGVAMARVVVR
jgi:hypothetical protein